MEKNKYNKDQEKGFKNEAEDIKNPEGQEVAVDDVIPEEENTKELETEGEENSLEKQVEDLKAQVCLLYTSDAADD
mgnify:CR=1 FL=1